MIVHPVTGEKLDISSTAGRSVLKNYLEFFNNGGSSEYVNFNRTKLQGFINNIDKMWREKGSNVDPNQLNEIATMVTGKIEDLKELIGNSNFVSRSEIDGYFDDNYTQIQNTINDRITDLEGKIPKVDVFEKKLRQAYDETKSTGLNLDQYFTKKEVKDIEGKIEDNITEKFKTNKTEIDKIKGQISTLTPETKEGKTDTGDFNQKLIDTGLFTSPEESDETKSDIVFNKNELKNYLVRTKLFTESEADGIKFNEENLPINEDKLNQKLEDKLVDYKLIEGKTEGDDTYTATINKDRIQRIEDKLRSLEDKETDTKVSESSGIDEKLRDILINGEILEEDEDKKLKIGEILKNLITFADGSLDKVIEYVEERSPIFKIRMEADDVKGEIKEQIEKLTGEYSGGDASLGDNTETNEDKLTKLENLLKKINELIGEIDNTEDTEIKELQNELDNINKEVQEITPKSTFVGGADPPDIRTYKDNDEPVDRLKEPLREKDMKRIIDLIEEGKKTTGAESKVDTEIQQINRKIQEFKNKNKELDKKIRYIDERDKNSNAYKVKYLKKEGGRQFVKFIGKDNTTTEPIDTLQKPLTGQSLRELIDNMKFGPEDKQKTIKTIVDELNNKDDSKIDEKIETIVNPIINQKTKDIETQILKSIHDKFSTFNSNGGRGITARDSVINKVTTVLNSLVNDSDAYERGF